MNMDISLDAAIALYLDQYNICAKVISKVKWNKFCEV